MDIEEIIEGLIDVNVGDKVFRVVGGDFIGKVRLKRRGAVNGGEAFAMSISQADETGKARLRRTRDRAEALAAIDGGEDASNYFIIGPKVIVTIYLTNADSTPEGALLTEIKNRIAELETFSTKQADVETIHESWGI